MVLFCHEKAGYKGLAEICAGRLFRFLIAIILVYHCYWVVEARNEACNRLTLDRGVHFLGISLNIRSNRWILGISFVLWTVQGTSNKIRNISPANPSLVYVIRQNVNFVKVHSNYSPKLLDKTGESM